MDIIMKKWREPLINIEDIEFKNIIIKSVNSYPPAGNDVMACTGIYKDSTIDFFVKIQRSNFADFESEMKILNNLKTSIPIPKVLEFGEKDNLKYIVLTKLEGAKYNDNYSEEDLNKYGEKLAEIHSIDFNAEIATQRKINDYPKIKDFKNDWEKNIVVNYLIKNKPDITYDTFIHGDFHYGNILWKHKQIVGVLDWEYSGLGFKEQDIAWTLVLRNTQKFLNTIDEINFFLEGYNKKGSFNKEIFKWCLINGYTHLYLNNVRKKELDKVYVNKLEFLINTVMTNF